MTDAPASHRAPAPPADSELVVRASGGDEAAFAELYRRHAGRVFALCLRLAASRGAAEELTQDVFVRTWERLATFRGDSAFSTWLHRLAINLVLARRRADCRRRKRIGEDDALEGLEPPSHGVDPGLQLDLEGAIGRLPEGARTVLVLHDIEGYTHEEIGDLTGIAPGTSKAQLFRARRLLREALDR